jgi:hypothetical protein
MGQLLTARMYCPWWARAFCPTCGWLLDLRKFVAVVVVVDVDVEIVVVVVTVTVVFGGDVDVAVRMLLIN